MFAAPIVTIVVALRWTIGEDHPHQYHFDVVAAARAALSECFGEFLDGNITKPSYKIYKMFWLMVTLPTNSMILPIYIYMYMYEIVMGIPVLWEYKRTLYIIYNNIYIYIIFIYLIYIYIHLTYDIIYIYDIYIYNIIYIYICNIYNVPRKTRWLMDCPLINCGLSVSWG